ncbi:MAG: hypothetical protein ACOYT8_04940 [Candidatus Dependentiae bacterium]
MKLYYLLLGSLIVMDVSTMEKNLLKFTDLPYELQTTEIIKQILNTSSTRDEALTLLSNYAQVNKAIAHYIKENKESIKKILNQKFDLSLTALASGNYDNPNIQQKTLRILKEALVHFAKIPDAKGQINSLINSIKNQKQTITKQDLKNYLSLFNVSTSNEGILCKSEEVSAIILGALNNFFINNRFTFTNKIGNELLKVFYLGIEDEYKIYLGVENTSNTQILALIIDTVQKIFGSNFINNQPLEFSWSLDRKTLREWIKDSGNQEAIKYLEKLKD